MMSENIWVSQATKEPHTEKDQAHMSGIVVQVKMQYAAYGAITADLSLTVPA